jgi:hypothetical protein
MNHLSQVPQSIQCLKKVHSQTTPTTKAARPSELEPEEESFPDIFPLLVPIPALEREWHFHRQQKCRLFTVSQQELEEEETPDTQPNSHLPLHHYTQLPQQLYPILETECDVRCRSCHVSFPAGARRRRNTTDLAPTAPSLYPVA